MVALIVPEAVLLFAGLQWYEAKMLCKELNALHEQYHPRASDPTSAAEQNPPNSQQPIASSLGRHFPLEYGFYAGMGGFQIETNRLSESSRAPPLTQGRMALTACAIIALGRVDVFIALDKRTIGHKSQVDVVAKTLAIFQVTWMVIEASYVMRRSVVVVVIILHSAASGHGI